MLLFLGFQGFAAARRRKETISSAGMIVAGIGFTILVVAARANPRILLAVAPGAIPAAAGILALRGRLKRVTILEITGIASLSIQGAGGLLLGGGSISAAGLLAIAAFTYFLLSLIWVRMRLARELPGRATIFPVGWNMTVSLALLLASAAAGLLLRGFAAGMLPGIYVARGVFRPPRRADGKLNISMLGVQEAIVAALFTAGLGIFLPA
jgi:hypothetical protein